MRSPRRVATMLALAGAVALAPAAGAGQFPRFGGGCSRADFPSSGTLVRAELCRTSSPGGRAVVVLHGCGGFSTFDHRIVAELPRYGISTLDVDFFGPTPPPGKRGFCGGARRIGTDPFPVWVQVAKDAASALRATRGIDSQGVGIVGWSLGGGVALNAAQSPPPLKPAQDAKNARVFDAVAGFSTYGDTFGAADLPPTILLSAGSTDAIPLVDMLPLYRALQKAHVPSALYVYPHGSHAWPRTQGTLGIQHAAEFLRRYLR